MKILSHDKVYVVGFLFSEDLSEVLLIEKQRPAFQFGKLNGIGGGVDEGEDIYDAQVRELEEESGVKTKKEDWIHFADFVFGKGMKVCFLVAKTIAKPRAKTMTDEEVAWVSMKNLPENILSDIEPLLPLAKNILKKNRLSEPALFRFE